MKASVQRVADALEQLGIQVEITEFAESTRTAEEAAAAVNSTLGQIVKSMIFKGKVSDKPILVLTSGANRVDEKRISQYAGESIGRADPDFVRAVTGFAIGGVPPVGDVRDQQDELARAGPPSPLHLLQKSRCRRGAVGDDENALLRLHLGYSSEEGKAPDRPATVPGPTRERRGCSSP